MSIEDKKLCEIAESVLRENRFMTLATCGIDGKPWAAPMMYAVDESDCFYWVSAHDAVHSIHIHANPSIAFVIFDSDPEFGSAQGLYCSANAYALSGEDLDLGCKVFYKMRYPNPEERAKKGRLPSDFLGQSPRRMYRAKVTEYSILHPSKHPVYGSLVDYRSTIPFCTAAVGQF